MITKIIKAVFLVMLFASTGSVLTVFAQSEVRAEYASNLANSTRMVALYNLATGSEDCPAPFEYKGTIIKAKYDEEMETKIIGFTIADGKNRRTYFNIDEDLYNEIKLPLVDLDYIDTLITKGRQVNVLAYGCGASGRALMAQNIIDLAFIKNLKTSKNSPRQELGSSKVLQKPRPLNAKADNKSSDPMVWLRNKDNPVRQYGQEWSEDYYYGIENYRERQIGMGQPTKTYKYYDPDDLSYEWEPYYSKPSNCRTPNYNPEPTSFVKLFRPAEADIRHQPRALYTKKAWENKTEGSIKLKVVLLADGTVGQITLLNQLPNGLTDSVMRAVCYITFRPATNTTLQPIDSIQTLTYQFNFSQAYSPNEYSYPKKSQPIQKEQTKTEEIVPLRIISKPLARYTVEARKNEIAGTVKLKITFLASGKIGAITVVSGLPDGLTQEAVKAARNIKFEPQTKGGKPYTIVKEYQWTFSPY